MSISQTRDSNLVVLLLSCAPGPPISLSILVRAHLCGALKGVVHTVVGNFTFLAISLEIWQFLRKIYFLCIRECVCECGCVACGEFECVSMCGFLISHFLLKAL